MKLHEAFKPIGSLVNLAQNEVEKKLAKHAEKEALKKGK